MSIEAKTAILEHLGRHHHAMVTLLADLVNIDSGSYNKRGVDEVGARLRGRLEAAGISCEIFPNGAFGDCIAARLPASGGSNRPIVLMGHRDTVFPDGTAAQRPFRIEGNQAFGPGVADMKSGLVMNTFVLDAFRRFGAPCPLTGLYTSDEEIASPSSRPVIEAEARDARAVLNSEPGRPSGNLVSRRNGAAFIEFEVTGQAAHSGVAHAQGVSGVEALARKVQRLRARVSIRHHSSSRWALPPTAPVPLKVGVPSTAVKPLSAEPPVSSPATRKPRSAAERSYASRSSRLFSSCSSGRKLPSRKMRPSLPGISQQRQISRTSPRIFSMMLRVGNRTSTAAVARAATVLTAVPP